MSGIAKKLMMSGAPLEPIEYIGSSTSTSTSVSLSGLVQDGDLVVVAATSPYNSSVSWSGMTITSRYTAYYRYNNSSDFPVYGFFGSGFWNTGDSTTLSASGLGSFPTILAAVFRNVIDFEAADKSGVFATDPIDPPAISTPNGARLFITPAHAAKLFTGYPIYTFTHPTGYTLTGQVANSEYSRTAMAYKILEDPATSENPSAWGGAAQSAAFAGTSGFS